MNLETFLINLRNDPDSLIHALDDIARDFDHYGYGLPVHNDHMLQTMRSAIYAWLAEHSNPVREDTTT